MLYRLVSVGVVAHVHHLHLPDLVDREAVVAVVEEGRYTEYAVEHRDEGIVTSHQADQAGGVVEYAPGVMQAVPFGEVSSPFERTERTRETAVPVLPDHQVVLRIEEVAVVEGCLGIRSQLFLALAQGLAE